MKARRWRQRLAAFILIFAIEYLAGIVEPLFPRDGWYYVICAAINLATYFIFSNTFDSTGLMMDLKILILLQCAFQLLGLGLYHDRQLADTYNHAVLSIVTATYVRPLLVVSGDDLTVKFALSYSAIKARIQNYFGN